MEADKRIPVVIFAAMRRSGSHFAMHRTLSCVRISGPQSFGAHINSIGARKLDPGPNQNGADLIANRKLNYFYTDEKLSKPRWSDDEKAKAMRRSLYSWLNVEGKQCPSNMNLDFLAINIEDIEIDNAIQLVKRAFAHNPLFASTIDSFPVFVPVRALRSIALSRKRLLEKRTSNVMADGFRQLKVNVWEDHYRSAINGQTSSGHPVVPLHYKEGTMTHGQSFVDAFVSNVDLPCLDTVPEWIRGSVMPDATGSSFVGCGKDKESKVIQSIEDRSHRLDEFKYLFERSKLAKQHAERFGEA